MPTKKPVYGPQTPDNYELHRSLLGQPKAPSPYGSPYGTMPSKAPLTQQPGPGFLSGVMSANNRIGAQNQAQVGRAVQAAGNTLWQQDPSQKPLPSSSETAGRILNWNNQIAAQNQAQANRAVQAAGNTLWQQDPSRQPLPSSSETAGRILSGVNSGVGALASAAQQGMQQVDPQNRALPMRSPSEVAGGLFSGLYGAGQQAYAGLANLGSNAVSAMTPGITPAPPRPSLPPPPNWGASSQPATGSAPEAPVQQNPQANPQLPAAAPGPNPNGVAPGGPLPMSFSQGMGPLAQPQNPFNVVSQGPRPVSPENRNLADQIRAIHERNFPNENRTPTVPIEVPPLADQLYRGGNPITAPTGGSMASAAMAQAPGGLLTNSQASANYMNSPRDSKYMPSVTAGGAFGQPSPVRNPNDPETQKQISQAQSIARLGNGREAILAGLNGMGKLGPGSPPVQAPQHDFGIKPSGLFEDGGRKKGGYTSLDQQRMADAKALFDSRGGGVEQRQKDYQARQVAERDQRSAGVLASAQARNATREEARRLRSGKLTFDERLAMVDPQAAATRSIGQGQLGLAKAQNESTNAFRNAQLQSQERRDKDRNATMERVAALRAGVDPNTGGAPKAPGSIFSGDERDYSGKSLQEKMADIKDLPPETQDRMRNQFLQEEEQKRAFDAIRGGKGSNPIGNFFAYPFDAIGSWLAGRPKDFAQLPTRIKDQIKNAQTKK